jgi:hypothetical protein
VHSLLSPLPWHSEADAPLTGKSSFPVLLIIHALFKNLNEFKHMSGEQLMMHALIGHAF